ncbi:thermonuclease family protein [Aurantimonas coralicida]|uniref:thermonuclease family protein n=1 Tax=Aurantimonas coralicida TaxID=182270 RepID=UPI0023970F5A|nr:thermonuclease family protein [Aurantimonas coralicida]MDE0924814.1 thermonuclease family protein [Aurantimonas coralicida]
MLALVWVFAALSPGGGTLPPPAVRLAAVEAVEAVEAGPDDFACTVEGVHDGDGPIYCRERDRKGRKIKIRLSGLAAREINGSCRSNQPCPDASGEAAKEELLRLSVNRVLRCHREGMSYARTVATCSNGDGDLSCAMIRSGTALRWERYDPHGRLVGCRNPRAPSTGGASSAGESRARG